MLSWTAEQRYWEEAKERWLVRARQAVDHESRLVAEEWARKIERILNKIQSILEGA